MAKGKKPALTPWRDAREERYKDVVLEEKPGINWGLYHKAREIALTHPTRANLLQWIEVYGRVYVNGNHQVRSSVFKTLLNKGEVKLIRASVRRNYHVYPDGSKRKVIRGNSQSYIVLADKE